MDSNTYKRLSSDERLRNYLPVFIHSCCSNFKQSHTTYKYGIFINHLILTLKGEGVARIGGETYTLTPGEIFFYKSGIPVEYYGKDENFFTCFVTFSGSACDPLMEYYNFPQYFVFKNEKIADSLIELCQTAERGVRDELLSPKIYSILNSIGLHISSDTPTKSFEKAIAYIRRNYNHDLPISEIAQHVGISKSLLFKLFRKVAGTTPVDYINSLRIDWAKHFLDSSPDIPVSEIGKNVGFSSSSYFIECFKKKEGITPLQFRKELQK